MKASPVVVIAGVRTPFTKAGTSLAGVGAAELARAAMVGVMVRTALDPARLEEVIFGCVAQPADALNLARVAALRSGVPKHVPALTVQRNCASGIEAVAQAWLRIQSGEGELYLVGGVESMSAPRCSFPNSHKEVRIPGFRQGLVRRKPAPICCAAPAGFCAHPSFEARTE